MNQVQSYHGHSSFFKPPIWDSVFTSITVIILNQLLNDRVILLSCNDKEPILQVSCMIQHVYIQADSSCFNKDHKCTFNEKIPAYNVWSTKICAAKSLCSSLTFFYLQQPFYHFHWNTMKVFLIWDRC